MSLSSPCFSGGGSSSAGVGRSEVTGSPSSPALPNYRGDESLLLCGGLNGPDGRSVAAVQSPVMEIFNI